MKKFCAQSSELALETTHPEKRQIPTRVPNVIHVHVYVCVYTSYTIIDAYHVGYYGIMIGLLLFHGSSCTLRPKPLYCNCHIAWLQI